MVMWKHKNIYGDFGCWNAWPLHHFAHVLTLAKGLNLIGRLFWGTDAPFGGDPVETIKMFRRLPEYTRKTGMEPFLTDEDIDLVLGENARKFAGI